MDNRIEKILFDKEEIQQRAIEIAEQINHDYQDRIPLFVSVLKGAVLWTADILKYLTIDADLDFIDLSSYHGGLASTNTIELTGDMSTSVNGRDVVVIEDIVDTGQTLKHLVDLLKERGAKSVKVVSMLDKKAGRKIDISVDYVGFDIENLFIVGYGLDYKELLRNIPYVGILKPDVYK